MQQQGFFWHVYHYVLFDWCNSYDEHLAYILREKPPEEHELRLRLMQPVKNIKVIKTYKEAIVPADKVYRDAVTTAQKAYHELGVLDETNGEALGLAWEVYLEATRDALAPVLALHAQECPNCPWDGRTIFPEEDLTKQKKYGIIEKQEFQEKMKKLNKKEYRMDVCGYCEKETYFEGYVCSSCKQVKSKGKFSEILKSNVLFLID